MSAEIIVPVQKKSFSRACVTGKADTGNHEYGKNYLGRIMIETFYYQTLNSIFHYQYRNEDFSVRA